MTNQSLSKSSPSSISASNFDAKSDAMPDEGFISSLDELAVLADYSLMDNLNCDPDATDNGLDHRARQVFSGHYVPVTPTPIKAPEYITHSKTFFAELGLADSLALSSDFKRLFSGDMSQVPLPMRKVGWATGYALSIYGTEYTQQCPFQTGNGYGDGRAISVLEAVIKGQRWEMQLKGAGPTPYCRGGDGRAVLRSSVREFLAQEHMQALGVPTSRSLSLYASKSETVDRPWYSPGSRLENPDRMMPDAVAISTRVAPSFLRVGQLELFARRARNHAKAMEELEKIVLHLIEREYATEIDAQLSLSEKVLRLAEAFRTRLIALVANWIRVGFCQGNFNSDNCAAGGFTLDYGPFGFCDVFNPNFQPWTGGGQHYAFMNQTNAAQRNFESFCTSLRPLLGDDQADLLALEQIQSDFSKLIHWQMDQMWAAKLGLSTLLIEGADRDYEALQKTPFKKLLNELQTLMMKMPIDYTIFFRELSAIPDDISPLKKSFYIESEDESDKRWSEWLTKWKALLKSCCEQKDEAILLEDISVKMKLINPKYSLREWFLVSAYQHAAKGDYHLIHEIQEVMSNPYAEQSEEIAAKYYRLKSPEYFNLGGCSHMSCSS